MNDRDWEKFFELMDKIINIPKMSWQDKRDEVMAQAETNAASGSLDEFNGWFPKE